MNPNLSDRLLSLMRSLSRTDSPTIKIAVIRDGTCRSAQLYHTQHKEGQIEKAIPSLYKRRDREAKGATSYETENYAGDERAV